MLKSTFFQNDQPAFLIRGLFLFLVVLTMYPQLSLDARGSLYYIDGSLGNDKWNGLSKTYNTDDAGPWKSFDQAKQTLQAGERCWSELACIKILASSLFMPAVKINGLLIQPMKMNR